MCNCVVHTFKINWFPFWNVPIFSSLCLCTRGLRMHIGVVAIWSYDNDQMFRFTWIWGSVHRSGDLGIQNGSKRIRMVNCGFWYPSVSLGSRISLILFFVHHQQSPSTSSVTAESESCSVYMNNITVGNCKKNTTCLGSKIAAVLPSSSQAV